MKWIRVRIRLPEFGQQALATFKGQFGWVMFVARNDRWEGFSAPGYAAPTYWKPLPNPPSVTGK